jgi:hypothetical protein
MPGKPGNSVTGVGVKDGSLWVQADRLFRLDPGSGDVTGALPLPPALTWSEYNLAFGFGSVWVRRVDKLIRIEPQGT